MAVFGVVAAFSEFIAPFAGLCLLRDLENPSQAVFEPWIWVTLLFLGPLIKSVSKERCTFIKTRAMVRLKLSLVQELYEKALRSRTSDSLTIADIAVRQEVNVSSRTPLLNGDKRHSELDSNKLDVIGLITKDVEDMSSYQSADIVLASINVPINLCLGMAFLYYLVGWSSFIGLVILSTYIPVTAWLTRLLTASDKIVTRATDARVLLVSEYVRAIRTIKYLTWEIAILNKVGKARHVEQRHRWRRSLYSVAIHVFGDSIPLLALLGMFLAFTMGHGKHLSAATAFTSYSIIEVVRGEFLLISAVARSVTKAYVACKRIDAYLASPNYTPHPIGPLLLKNATLRRTATSTFLLRNITVDFVEGKLNLVTGPSGSGKTTLLLSLMGETLLEHGCVSSSTLAGYVSQQPVILNDTIRHNILFHSDLPFNALRYNAVIDACGLTRDITALELWDMTVIGPGGRNLSGGQRQRIALARSVYSRCRILLLDDVFSSLDNDTVIEIWNRCFLAGLLRNRTVVLTSYHNWLENYASLVLIMDRGELVKVCLKPGSLVRIPRKREEYKPLAISGSSKVLDLMNTSPIAQETRNSSRGSRLFCKCLALYRLIR
jgi:ABC-type multidrug transport system fused ATPase/permease subunit